MGRRDRERKERIQAGAEAPIRNIGAVARFAIKHSSRGAVVGELSRGTTAEQVERLDTLAGEGALPPAKLRKALEKNAPKEMDKAIRKFRKEGKKVSTDNLLSEVKSEPGFLEMCTNVGLTLEWFENLARERMEAHGYEK